MAELEQTALGCCFPQKMKDAIICNHRVILRIYGSVSASLRFFF